MFYYDRSLGESTCSTDYVILSTQQNLSISMRRMMGHIACTKSSFRTLLCLGNLRMLV